MAAASVGVTIPPKISPSTARMIKKKGSKYCVVSKSSGRNLGCSKSKKGAVKRLRQVEYFKRKK